MNEQYTAKQVNGRFEFTVYAGDGTPFAKISDKSSAEVCRLAEEFFEVSIQMSDFT